MKRNISINFGGGFGLLFAALVILKLLKLIHISWWWVTAPIWGPLAILAIVMVLVLLGIVIATWLDHRRWKKLPVRR